MPYCPNPKVSSRIVDGEVIVLDHTNEKIHQLNSTASFVWSLLDGTIDLPTVATELVEHFDVSEQRASADAKRILQEFEDLQLVISSAQQI